MIHFELLRDRNILIITPDGPLEETDFARLSKEVDPFIASKGKLAGVMVYAKSFRVGEFRIIRKIERIAAVTDSGFLKIMPRIADHFVQAKIRHFDFEERDQALAWLETGQ